MASSNRTSRAVTRSAVKRGLVVSRHSKVCTSFSTGWPREETTWRFAVCSSARIGRTTVDRQGEEGDAGDDEGDDDDDDDDGADAATTAEEVGPGGGPLEE